MFVAQAHSFTQQARLAITLAWIAGYTNILTILTCGTVTSHATGTVSQLGRDVAEGHWGLLAFCLFLLGTFLAGAFLSGFCTELGRRRGWESIYVLPMVLQALLLAAFAIGVEAHDRTSVETGARLYLLVGLASMAMGLQNATITRISGGVVRTTHMTGVLTDLGLETAQFGFWLVDRQRNSPPSPLRGLGRSIAHHPTARRLALLGSIIGSFALGAGLAAAAYARFPSWAMFPPVVFLLWIVVQDIRTPICEIEASATDAEGHGIDLPKEMAVYHLRKSQTRRGNVHRMPDLLRWYERLPEGIRVIILDLDAVTVLDANAALELRALIRQSEARGRWMVISGITGEQFRSIREAGAGDALDPTNVCADLELAIARGLMLLDMPRPSGH